jgi:hypothetical protein
MAEGRHALVVSISDYRDKSLRKLKAPAFDGKALAKVLRDPAIGMFDLTLVSDKDAHVVEQAIERFYAGRSVDDTLLLYFSGHGIKDDAGNLYLAARNTTQHLLRSTAIPDAFLREVMKGCRARRQVLILDCCFGGAFAKGLLTKAGTRSVGVNEMFEGQGRVILTASNAMEFAFEEDEIKGEPRLSVFTRTLVRGLQSGEADVDGDGQVSVQDLYSYAHKRIALPGSSQTPTISSVGQEGEIILARVPAGATGRTASPLLPSTGAATARRQDLRPWVRIRDQAFEGSNPAVAAVTAVETFLAVQGSDMRLSPRYVYQKAKLLAGGKQEQDTGVTMEILARVLEEFGAAPEKAWPYVPGKWQMPKNQTWKTLDAQAEPYRARLIPVTAIDELPMHLAKGRPVLGSFKVHESSWYGKDTTQRGVIGKPPVSGKSVEIGTIALTIVDFDAARQVIHFAHTWGPAWGDRGFGEMPVETAQATFVGEQMWAIEARSKASFSWSPASALPGAGVPPAGQAPGEPAAPVPDETETPDAAPTRERRAGAGAARKARTGRTEAALSGKARRLVYDAKHERGDWSKEKLPAKALARREGAPSTGDRAVDATYDALGRVHAFFHEVFGRDSWDGRGAPLEAVVHYGRDFENAFWDGRRVILGDGGENLTDFYRLDVIAKECSMGFVQSETGLRYQDQSGALFQSLGLVFASMVKQFASKQTAAKANWLIGDGLVAKGRALVSLEEPGSAYDNPVLGKDPAVGHMAKYVKTASDNGGVHINCGIPNRAFVLIARELGGHSWDRAGKVWYEVVCSGKLRPGTGFAQFASRTVATAKTRFGVDVERTVRAGWAKVGIKV